MLEEVALLRMDWVDVVFAHWPVDPAVVADRLPPGLTVDTCDGRAWLSVVAFRMQDAGPTPSVFAPFRRSFPELNLRTYVSGVVGRPATDPGIYFFSLETPDRLAVRVARATTGLPYFDADLAMDVTDEAIHVESERTHRGQPRARFDATVTPGDPVDGDDRARFLTERYRFYATVAGRLVVGSVRHDPWHLQRATLDLRTNDLFAAAGFDAPPGDPLVHYAQHASVVAGPVLPA
ncbi:YqjF family protein [Haloarchaeobius sp. HRN-SO-5]|uniref:YqjF family protein n=1 Tax=Haloarchaeobius sp. HRN-SO-5 TaxID=3446118 RepID=UPI003EBEC2DB